MKLYRYVRKESQPLSSLFLVSVLSSLITQWFSSALCKTSYFATSAGRWPPSSSLHDPPTENHAYASDSQPDPYNSACILTISRSKVEEI